LISRLWKSTHLTFFSTDSLPMAHQPNEREGEAPKILSTSFSAPPNGIYYLYNIGIQKYLDVQGLRTADGTSIFAFTLNDPPTDNQKWKYVRQSPDGLICTLQSAHANGFIYAISLAKGTALVQSQTPVVWQLDPCGENLFRIRLLAAKEPLVLAFSSKSNRTPAILQVADSNNSRQLWSFHTT